VSRVIGSGRGVVDIASCGTQNDILLDKPTIGLVKRRTISIEDFRLVREHNSEA
jgi:hypothetical protein